MKLRIKEIVINIFLFILFSIIALGIGELIIRSLFAEKMTLFPRYHTDAKYGEYTLRRIKPDWKFKHSSVEGVFHYKTNNKGFRNDYDVTYEKPTNTLRAISLGDSHTQGYEVNQNETFSFITEERLRENNVKAEVINTGVSGFGTAEELVFLENEGIKYHPDYVILGLFNNDFENNVASGLFELKNGTLKKTERREYTPGINIQNTIYRFKIIKFLGENSYLYAFAFNAVWNNSKNLLAKISKEKIVTEYAIPMEEVSQYNIQLGMAIINRMFTFCKNNNIKFIIVDIPTTKGSSVPKGYENTIRNYCDKFFYYQEMLKEYGQLKKTHVPHGAQHISAQTHSLLGKKIAAYIMEDSKI